MDFVIIANAWAAMNENPTSKHQVAMELARQGHRVLWLDGTGMRKPTLGSSSDRSRIIGKIMRAMTGTVMMGENLWCAAPLVMPFPRSRFVRNLNAWLYRIAAGRLSRRLHFRKPILINFLPVIPKIHSIWSARSVYYCVDRWESFSQYDTDMMRAADEACLRNADLVVTTSHYLQERSLKVNARSVMLSHGVDYEHFASALIQTDAPADLPCDKPILGFIGLISEWVDQDLLVRTARANPEARLVLIGKADVPVDRLSAEKNILLLGPQPYLRLPAYLARFRAGLIPFAVNELTEAVNPIKLREMLAAGCPVVSTALPEVAEAAKGGGEIRDKDCGIDIAKDHSGFVELVKERLRNPLSAEERQKLSGTMKNETWREKVEELVAETEEKLKVES